MIEVACEWCGGRITCYPSARRRFCSKSCRGFWQAKAHPQPRLPQIECAECGATFKPKSRRTTLCSRACRAQVASRAAANALRDTGEGKTYRKLNGRHEHRVVAERMLGRPLRPGEVVHHIDEDKRNNNPSNLMVFESQAAHVRHHRELGERKECP
jgi:hypothetical protein